MGLLGKTLSNATTIPGSKEAKQNVREKTIILSKEEYQQRLFAEESKLKHLTEALKTEKEIHARSIQKVQINWRRILSMVKSEDFKSELELQSFLFQREIESKDSFIQSLDSQLEDCLDQYQCALRSHYIHLDKYSVLLKKKLEDLDQAFQDNLQILRQEFSSEHEVILQMHNNQVYSKETQYSRNDRNCSRRRKKEKRHNQRKFPTNERRNKRQNWRRNGNYDNRNEL